MAFSLQTLEEPWKADECQSHCCAEERLGHKQVQAPRLCGKPMPENISAWRDTCDKSDFWASSDGKASVVEAVLGRLEPTELSKSHGDSLAAQKMNFRSPFPYNEQHNPPADLSLLFLGSALRGRSTETLNINLTEVFHCFVPPVAAAWRKGLGDLRESRNPLPPNSTHRANFSTLRSLP